MPRQARVAVKDVVYHVINRANGRAQIFEMVMGTGSECRIDYMKKTFLFKIKEGKLDQWKDWCFELNSIYKEDARHTLQHENATREYGVLFPVGNTYYVYGTTEYFDTPIQADMDITLNQKHKRNFDECLEYVSKGEILYDIKN